MQHTLEKVLDWFESNVPQDRELRRRGRLTLAAVGILAATSLLIAIAEVLIRGPSDPRTIITAGTAAYSLAALAFFRITGSVWVTAISFLVTLQAACTMGFFVSEVSTTAALVWHFVVPPAGMFLLGTRGGSLLTMVCLTSLVTAQGVVPTMEGRSPDLLLLFVTWAAMLVIASLAFFFETSRHNAALLAARRQRETENALAQAEQTSRYKTEFLAKMSHEIRTPMNAILMSQHLLLHEDLAPKHEELLRLALQSGDSLLTILDDILDVSRVEAGQLKLDSRPFSPRAVITSVEQLLRTVATAKSQSLNIELHPSLPEWVAGDPVRVRQILLNLVNNAIKFTPSGGTVTLRARATDNENVTLDVVDNGPGVSEEIASSIYDPFFRGDEVVQGTGLGLTVTKGLVLLMNGSITVQPPPGGGTHFEIVLPLHQSAAPPETAYSGTFAEPIEPLNHATRRPVVLLAEDNPINQALTARMLELRGYHVQAVPDGESACERAEEGDIDLVLMDCSMPILDGFQATQRIRRLGSKASLVPIIAMTANAMAGERQRCLAAGMDDYLAKPVKPHELYQVIERWLNLETEDQDRPRSAR